MTRKSSRVNNWTHLKISETEGCERKNDNKP